MALLVLAYVLLGPLHYLTEILWLGERGYFLPCRRDVRWLSSMAAIGLATGANGQLADGDWRKLSSLLRCSLSPAALAITAGLAALVTLSTLAI